MNNTATKVQASKPLTRWEPSDTEFKRARLNTQPGCAYAHLNGKEFWVVEQVGNRTSVKINGQTTDFYGDEVTVTQTIKIPPQPVRYYTWGNEPRGYVSTWKLADNGEVMPTGLIHRDKLPKYAIHDCPYN
ncbi:MAG: hypothetical protein EPGJADBJ_04439 [Saprospiraceae bacterium]|nr:hypothetical protein [Saprospiraceae bacterium]